MEYFSSAVTPKFWNLWSAVMSFSVMLGWKKKTQRTAVTGVSWSKLCSAVQLGFVWDETEPWDGLLGFEPLLSSPVPLPPPVCRPSVVQAERKCLRHGPGVCTPNSCFTWEPGTKSSRYFYMEIFKGGVFSVRKINQESLCSLLCIWVQISIVSRSGKICS